MTYANAAAGLLAPLALLALAHHIDRASRATAVTACLLLTGLGATLSRGGFLAVAAGFVVLAALRGPRTVLSAARIPIFGAAVALAGLLPWMATTSRARPAVAAAALAAGIGLAAAWASGEARFRRTTAVGAVTVVIAAFAGSTVSGSLAPRLTVASEDRAGETRAALELAAAHPVFGVGPAWHRFAWTTGEGQVRVAEFAHNEYLQVLAELGAVGLALLIALLWTIGRLVWRARAPAGGPWVWAGSGAGLVAVAVHAALDFGWHVPAVALTGAVLVGMSITPNEEEYA